MEKAQTPASEAKGYFGRVFATGTQYRLYSCGRELIRLLRVRHENAAVHVLHILGSLA